MLNKGWVQHPTLNVQRQILTVALSGAVGRKERRKKSDSILPSP